MRSFFAIIIVGLCFVLALIFGARNEQVVTISYFIAEGEFRLPIVLAVVFLSGFVISWLFASFYILRMKMKLRKAEKQLDKIQDNQQQIAIEEKTA
ncbi:LapA family protein [Shewanella maritima]|uniref:LapA family protein n=1 Tax=Shewanella maritima TaxID=2520507 RepID=UPI003735C5BA